MKNIKFIILAFVFCFAITSVFAGPFNATAKTKRIPAGTTFQLEFLQPVSTFSGSAGDSFVATILNEQAAGSSIILPAGTVVRGSILEVKTAKYFSRGAKLYLDFGFEILNKEEVIWWSILKTLTNHPKLADFNTTNDIYDKRNIEIKKILTNLFGSNDFNYSVWYKNGMHNVYAYFDGKAYEYEYFIENDVLRLEEVRDKTYKR